VADTLTKEQRSERMSRVRSTGSKAEMVVRRVIHSMGYRYRLHAKDLPGHPDLVFKSRRKVIFVHGCFWHRHPGCKNTRMPKSKLDFWKPKLEGNRKHDLKVQRQLRKSGWSLLVIWECQTKNEQRLRKRIEGFMESTNAKS